MNRVPELVNVHITRTERLNHSVNGNPRFRLWLACGDLDLGMFVTSSDAACNYEISNYANSGAAFDAWLTRARRVEVIEAHPSQGLPRWLVDPDRCLRS